MKPIQTLTWAVSAPVLLFAGAAQAVTISELTDPACSGGFSFDSANNRIVCNVSQSAPVCKLNNSTSNVALSSSVNGTATITASCTPSATSYSWNTSSGAPSISGSGGALTFPSAGTFTYSVTGTNGDGTGAPSNTVTVTVSDGVSQSPPPPSSCPATPAGTTIIAMGGRDNYSKIDFNQAFDAPGNRIDSVSEAGQIKAWEFDNNAYLSGKITGTAGNYGSNYKDWSVSACPGDFSSSLPAACLKIRRTGLTLYYHATNAKLSDGTPSCVIPAGQKMYLNVRATDPTQAAGYVSSNSPSAVLP